MKPDVTYEISIKDTKRIERSVPNTIIAKFSREDKFDVNFYALRRSKKYAIYGLINTTAYLDTLSLELYEEGSEEPINTYDVTANPYYRFGLLKPGTYRLVLTVRFLYNHS